MFLVRFFWGGVLALATCVCACCVGVDVCGTTLRGYNYCNEKYLTGLNWQVRCRLKAFGRVSCLSGCGVDDGSSAIP